MFKKREEVQHKPVELMSANERYYYRMSLHDDIARLRDEQDRILKIGAIVFCSVAGLGVLAMIVVIVLGLTGVIK